MITPRRPQITEDELVKERDCVGHLLPNALRAVCSIKEDTMLPGEA
jgi:malate dehydrogenase (NADP+)